MKYAIRTALLCITGMGAGCRMLDTVAADADKHGYFRRGMSPAEVATVLKVSPPEADDFTTVHDEGGELSYWCIGPGERRPYHSGWVWKESWFFAFREDRLAAWGPAVGGTGQPVVAPMFIAPARGGR